MHKSPIQTASEVVGTQALLARLIGVKAPTIHQWIRGIRPVPIEHCVAIERATNGKVTRRDLRSDWQLIWPELADAQANIPSGTIFPKPSSSESAAEMG